MRVRTKIQHDRKWKPGPAGAKRYWVNLPDGDFFPVFRQVSGKWRHHYCPHADWPTMDAAIVDALTRLLHCKREGPKQYRRIRARQRIFCL